MTKIPKYPFWKCGITLVNTYSNSQPHWWRLLEQKQSTVWEVLVFKFTFIFIFEVNYWCIILYIQSSRTMHLWIIYSRGQSKWQHSIIRPLLHHLAFIRPSAIAFPMLQSAGYNLVLLYFLFYTAWMYKWQQLAIDEWQIHQSYEWIYSQRSSVSVYMEVWFSEISQLQWIYL